MGADFWEQFGEGENWNFHFVRNLNDWELDVIERFLSKLQGQTMKRKEENRVVWKEDCKGVFSIRGLYSLLGTNYATLSFKDNMELMDSFKVSFFTWEAC